MLPNSIFEITTEAQFTAAAIETFQFQYKNVVAYRTFCDFLNINPSSVKNIKDIPFLPIQFFKSHNVISSSEKPKITFTSSGTTGSITSNHHVASTTLYETSFLKGFTNTYGNIKDYVILALLPSYLEREGSSLIYMVDRLIKETHSNDSGFYLNNLDKLLLKIKSLEACNKKTILLGVSYALLDVIEKQKLQLKNTIVMETGGMKGKRKEMIKEELHTILKEGFGVNKIHSEYGMTELLSQAYSKGDGVYNCPPWMKVLTRDTEDALTYVENKTGGLNVIDLANYYSCSFIATQDLGKLHHDGSFKILGRFDDSDIRGCNLLVL
ncbi:acyl transferase [Patiriisocius hiemis]|uniref:Acyl transferase n=1 Tax=Patiriisocius hiemis TaxID=3075604 RepID=A0ABU2YDY3_9FLAO|nr:acyl transferase [Constantimarinum sp. W242]MDT0556383.1 acyl transferase [Constantimarinum sp. W242]